MLFQLISHTVNLCEVIYEMFHTIRLNCGFEIKEIRLLTQLLKYYCVYNCDDHSFLDSTFTFAQN